MVCVFVDVLGVVVVAMKFSGVVGVVSSVSSFSWIVQVAFAGVG